MTSLKRAIIAASVVVGVFADANVDANDAFGAEPVNQDPAARRLLHQEEDGSTTIKRLMGLFGGASEKLTRRLKIQEATHEKEAEEKKVDEQEEEKRRMKITEAKYVKKAGQKEIEK